MQQECDKNRVAGAPFPINIGGLRIRSVLAIGPRARLGSREPNTGSHATGCCARHLAVAPRGVRALSDLEPATWPLLPRPNPLYDALPSGWRLFIDAIEQTGRLIYRASEWTGQECCAPLEEDVASAIAAMSDDEFVDANRRRLEAIAKKERQRREELAAAVSAPAETVRRAPPEDITQHLARARAVDQQNLRKLQTRAGRAAARERQLQLTREWFEQEAVERWRPYRERWDEARRRLVSAIGAGNVAAAVWLTPSRRLIALRPTRRVSSRRRCVKVTASNSMASPDGFWSTRRRSLPCSVASARATCKKSSQEPGGRRSRFGPRSSRRRRTGLKKTARRSKALASRPSLSASSPSC